MAFTLPSNPGAERDAAILTAIKEGRYTVPFGTVKSTTPDGQHSGEFRVFADALKIDGVRINVSASLGQQIADILGCSLPTAKLEDLAYKQRQVTLPPFPAATINVDLKAMDTTGSMIKESDKIDEALAAQGNPGGIIRTVGKAWILDNGMVDASGRPKTLSGVAMACNYGWAFEGTFQGQKFDAIASDPGSGVRVIQGRGFRHDCKHTDYSQMCLLVDRNCIIDGQPMDLLDVFVDPKLAKLASHDGILKVLRQPGAPGGPEVKPRPAVVASIMDPIEGVLESLMSLGPSNVKAGSKGKTLEGGTDILRSSSLPSSNMKTVGYGLVGAGVVGLGAWWLTKKK
jgi:hypothetical protein